MDQDVNQVYNAVQYDRIYKAKAIQVGTFLGGPLVAGYLIAENFKAFNETDKVRRTWIYTIMTTIALFIIVFSVPASVKIPNIVFPLVYAWFTYYIVQHFQGQQINSHVESGGETYNWGRVIGIGLIGTAVTVVLVILVAYFIIA